MADDFAWQHWAGSRDTLPPGAAEAIDSVGLALGRDADVEEGLEALRSHGLGFIVAIMGLMAIKGVPLADAKWLVHASPAYADTREDREASWQATYDEIASDPGTEREHKPADQTTPAEDDPPQPR